MSIRRNEMIKIGVNKSQLKEYVIDGKNVVYLNDGDEFQIKLFNPFTFVLGAKIYINGESLHNILTIRPGETIWIERYLDSNNKFKFSTYTVENDLKSNIACRNCGEISVDFYKEYKADENTYTSTKSGNLTNKLFETSNQNYIKQGVYTSSSTPKLDEFYYSNINSSDMYQNANRCGEYTSYTPTSASTNIEYKETGLIEPGNVSYQYLNVGYYKFKTDASSFVSENVKILPMSEKQYTSNDLHKIYCQSCGRKMKTNYKYCPFCGSKLDI